MNLRRYCALLLFIFVIFSLIGAITLPAQALQSRTDSFLPPDGTTGTGAGDMVQLALKHEGWNGADFGYTEEWCADFISDCAILTGQESAIPAIAYCSGMYHEILSAGGKITTDSPRPGDICFINWDGGSEMQHVEIVYDVSGGRVSTIGGNAGSNSSLRTRTVKKHSPLSPKYIVAIVRPAYITVDTSYKAQCKRMESAGIIKIIAADTPVMTQPCREKNETKLLQHFNAGLVTQSYALYRNTAGEYWYEVRDGQGNTGFLFAGNTEFVSGRYDRISASGIRIPETIPQGSSCSITGSVSWEDRNVTRIRADVYSSTDGQVPVLSAEASVSGASYSLQHSRIDRNLRFSALQPGNYSFVLSAELSVPYSPDGFSLKEHFHSCRVYESDFSVLKKPAHVCNFRQTGGFETQHPHKILLRCEGCGAEKYAEPDMREDNCILCQLRKKYKKMQIGLELHNQANTLCDVFYNILPAEQTILSGTRRIAANVEALQMLVSNCLSPDENLRP